MSRSKIAVSDSSAMLNGQCGAAEALVELFSNISGVDEASGAVSTGNRKDVEASPQQIAALKDYDRMSSDIRQTLLAEIDVLDSRVVHPIRDLLKVFQRVRASITKRNHKLTDLDRFQNSLKKLKDKDQRSLSEEKNMFRLETDVERAKVEYEDWNERLKEELPRFFELCNYFYEPTWQTLYFLQVNIYYMTLERLEPRAKSGYFSAQEDPLKAYESRRNSVPTSGLERLGITKPPISKSRPLLASKPSGPSSVSAPPEKKPPPRPPITGKPVSVSSNVTDHDSVRPSPQQAPHLYSPRRTSSASVASNISLASMGSAVSSETGPAAAPPTKVQTPAAALAAAASAKKPPPPVPGNKPRAAKIYATALYDFEAQADGDLSLETGQRIELLSKSESVNDWWKGRNSDGVEGLFPANYVKLG